MTAHTVLTMAIVIAAAGLIIGAIAWAIIQEERRSKRLKASGLCRQCGEAPATRAALCVSCDDNRRAW